MTGSTDPRAAVEFRNSSLPKAAAMLASHIRGQILGHGLEPGAQLPSEAEWIAQSGLGRATVREAIRILEAQGLITIKRGSRGGIFVTRPNLSSLSGTLAPVLTLSKAPLRDLTTYRKIVEPPAAALAAEMSSEQEKQELLAIAQHDPAPGYVNEVSFHEQVARMSQNQLLRVLVVVPQDLLREHLKGEYIEQHDVEEANDAHLAIASAIASGNAERASRAMARHLEAFEARLEREGRLDRPIVAQAQWLRDSEPDLGMLRLN